MPSETIKIFVGCAANGEDAESQIVFEYAMRKLATQPIHITWMQLSREPTSFFYSDGSEGWQTQNWATPFTAFRWGIPAYCDYVGKAIYFDSDFIPRADIAELWNQPFQPGKVIIAKGAAAGTRYCCSMWDCAAAKTHLPPVHDLQGDRDAHNKLSRYFAKHQALVQPFKGGDWNVFDIGLPANLDAPSIKAIHYTQMHTQLQLKYALPRLKAEGRKHWLRVGIKPHPRPDLQELFDRYYAEAQAEGYSVGQYTPSPPYGSYSIRGL